MAEQTTQTTTQQQQFLGTGRRKTSVARVRLMRGTGQIIINKRDLDAFLPVERLKNRVLAPLKATHTLGKFDVKVNVKGGGITGQADAIMLGVSRALLKAVDDSEAALRAGGFLTRDSRMVERKKYGRAKARKKFQFSKR
jgi:small subunit ribosomal protein S9